MTKEKTCATCSAKYCRYANDIPKGKPQYNYKLVFDCRNHGYLMWSKPPREETE